MMKKLGLLLAAIGAIGWSSLYAQISKGGLPLSLQDKTMYSQVPVSTYVDPDWDGFLRKEQEQRSQMNRPLQVALLTATDFGFPQSGQLITLDNGQRVWRGRIQISGAPAIGLQYDQFYLPAGVRLFLTNANKKQVMGAYDISNNIPDGVFTSDAVQGETVDIELNLDRGADINQIKLHINKAMVFHRAIEHLSLYTIAGEQPLDQTDNLLNGQSSVCNINAICPQGIGYGNNRKATVQILHSDGTACSGTLVNNTGNSPGSCKPYILTATHCNQSGSEAVDTPFNQYIVRFNFEHSACTGSPDPTSSSMNGVRKVARASYSATMPANDIKGDFMLYELLQPIPASYGANLSGWDNSASIATSYTAPYKFIGFHHPYGDNKKLSTTQTISSVPLGAPDTHWEAVLEEGYAAPGSSGSGLFNGEGLLIGVASVAGEAQPPASCKKNKFNTTVYAMDAVYYSKFSYDWDYSANGTANNRKLKPWLDPANTGATTVATVKSDCSAASTTGINNASPDLSANIALYPNPVTTGTVSIQYNLPSATDLDIVVYDLSGKAVYQTAIAKALSGSKTLNLGNIANGVYLVKVATETGFTSKKIMIQR